MSRYVPGIKQPYVEQERGRERVDQIDGHYERVSVAASVLFRRDAHFVIIPGQHPSSQRPGAPSSHPF